MIVLNKFAKPLMRWFVVILICLPRLHAQTATNGPSDTRPAAANPAPATHAPDEMTKKISDQVHVGKYAEAEKLTTGLLVAYPDDQRLIKAKALLDKLIATAASVSAVPSGSQPGNSVTPPPPFADGASEQLTGMDKVKYNSLIELARQAQQNSDLVQQEALLKQFMDQSGPFLHKHPNEMLLWKLRAASAISLVEPMAGYEAGQKLLAAGAADSNDANLQQLLAQLNNNGWLDKQKAEELQVSADDERKQARSSAEAARLKAEHDKYTFSVMHLHGMSHSYGHLTINEDDAAYDAPDESIHFSKNDIRELTIDTNRVCSCGLWFIPRNGKTALFIAVNRTDAGDIFLPKSVLWNAVAERWRFMSTDNNKALKPPSPK
jgi:hypothetical protein